MSQLTEFTGSSEQLLWLYIAPIFFGQLLHIVTFNSNTLK